MHQKREEDLADPDSLFMFVDGIRVHYKCKQSVHGIIRRGIHLCHGTKNNLYCWDIMHQAIADKCDAIVTAADMTGHGLTTRPFSSKKYCRAFNGRLCRAVIEHELQKSDADAVNGIVLIGNSIGGLVHLIETIRAPQGISTVIAVSPVIPTSDDIHPVANGVLHRIVLIVWHIWRVHIVPFIKGFVFLCMLPLTFLLLRSKIPHRVVWLSGLSKVYDTNAAVEMAVDRFRLSALVRGFEYGTVMFDQCCLYEAYHSRTIADIWMKRRRVTFTEAFAEAIKKYDIRVLIVHGENDQIVPISSSEKFAKDVPGVELIRYPCGHMSNEELPDRFLEDVVNFISKG